MPEIDPETTKALRSEALGLGEFLGGRNVVDLSAQATLCTRTTSASHVEHIQALGNGSFSRASVRILIGAVLLVGWGDFSWRLSGHAFRLA